MSPHPLAANATKKQLPGRALVRCLKLLALLHALFLSAAWSQTVVTTEAELNAAISAGNAGGSKHIVFGNSITSAGTRLLGISGGGTWIIDGAGFTYDGSHINQGFTVYVGNVTFQNLTLANTRAVGGEGGGGSANKRQF